MIQLAQNNGRFYKVSIRQMRYFPVKKVVALAMLADGSAIEVPYMPFGKPEYADAFFKAQEIIEGLKVC
jgi:hypothetical protein